MRFGFPRWLSSKASTCNSGDAGSIPGPERSPGGGNGNPLQYSCPENSMDRGAWRATVPRSHKESDTTERLNQHPQSEILTGESQAWYYREAVTWEKGAVSTRNSPQQRGSHLSRAVLSWTRWEITCGISQLQARSL